MTDAAVAALPAPSGRPTQRLGWVAVVSLGALAYTILFGGTGRGELDGIVQIPNAVFAGFFLVLYLLRAPAEADRIDRGILLGLVLFLASAVLSQFPRQSFDAALSVFTAAAALFVLRGELARPECRRAFVKVFAGLSVALTFLTAALWLPTTLQWWSLTGWEVIPPLDLNFSAAPWGHRHDLALLVVLLYPSQWIAPLNPLRRVVAVLFGILVLLIVAIDGSRNLWLAVVASTAAILLPIAYRSLRASPRARRGVLIGLLGLVAVVLVSGLATALADRLLNLQSLGWRSAMWIPLAEAWTERPLAGFGPGSFPWILPLTDYYDTSTWAPRHPDSAFFQLLAEGGILGLGSAAVVVGTLLAPVLRGRSTAACWALLTFLLAGVGANPTDFVFLVAVAVAWTAYAAPREIREAPVAQANRLVRAGSMVALGVVAVAYASTTLAGLYYQSASAAVTARDLPQARRDLDTAIALDPGMALYLRQRGTLDYVAGNPGSGVTDLERAVRLNPSDDLGWRTLSLAYASMGDDTNAESATDRALDAQRSDAANLLLRAREQTRAGQSAQALETLGEVVQSWPATVAAPGWDSLLPESVTARDVIDEAVRRWEQGLPTPEPFAGQGLWLAALGDRSDLDGLAVAASGTSPELARAALMVFRCDPEAAEALDRLSDSDRRTQLFWQLRIRSAALEGDLDADALTQLQIMKGHVVLRGTVDDILWPIIETGFNTDIWGYRQRQIRWQTALDPLPAPDAAEVRWLFYPRDAAAAAGLEERLPNCR